MLRVLTPGGERWKLGFALALLCGLFLGGCASPTRVAMPPVKESELAPAAGVVGLRQQEIGTSINRSNLTAAAGGGLIFAMIDAGVNNSRAKKAESAASSVRDALIDYHPGEVLADALKTALSSTTVAVQHTRVVQIKDASTLPQEIKASTGKTVVVLDVTYELLPNFAGTRVVVFTTLHPREGALKGATREVRKLPEACYFNAFSSVRRFPFGGQTRPADAAVVWSSTEGKVAKEVLTASLTEIAQMIAYDLTVPARPDNALYKSKNEAAYIVESPSAPAGVLMRGYAEKTQNGRVWVRCPAGDLCAIAQ